MAGKLPLCPFCNNKLAPEPSQVLELGELSYWCRKCGSVGRRKQPKKGPVYWAKTEAKLEELMNEDKK
jgi:hypothetical protein